MASGTAGADHLNRLDALFRFGVVGDLSDGQLVRRFLTARDGADQAAFAALVERHGSMVLGVCRKVLDNPHDAQDAFQATFLVLARKAGSVRKADSVASWLHGVALRVARQARAEAGRRRVHERRCAAMKATEPERQGNPPEEWRELHEEIARLPGRYREPVVLCYLEGLSTDEAALRIGCPKGTILSRLSRARERLRGRLVRRGLAPPAPLLATGPTPRATAALPAGLLNATVCVSLGFAGGRATEAASASATVTSLARGVLNTMTISKLRTLGAAALACGFAWGGVHSFGQFGGRGEPAGAATDADEPQDALTRSVDKLQSALDESARRNAEMQKSLRDLRAELKARSAGEQPSPATKAVTRLASTLKHHPARLSRDPGWGYQIYMLDLIEGGTTLIVDEPIPGHQCSGRAKWSHDGSRIVFETTGGNWPRARLFAIEAHDGRPRFTELGDGNNPTFSPGDERIAFTLHAGNEAGAGGGVWMMNADGSGRHRAGDFGAPFWSPDGRELLVNSYSARTRSTVINLETEEEGAVVVPGHRIFSWPSWAGPGMLVSALAPREKNEGDSIALLDVRNPAKATIIDVLWKRSEGPDVSPRWPVYRPDTRECFFVGEEPTKRMIYTVKSR